MMDPSKSGQIAIVGSGAMGCYIGAHLVKGGYPVHFLAQSNYEALKTKGIYLERRHGENIHVKNLNVYGISRYIPKCSLVIITLKATANYRLPEFIGPIIDQETQLLTLQNGLGNVEFLKEHFPNTRVLGALCFMALVRKEPWRVRNYIENGGYMTLGEAQGPASEYARTVTRILQNAEIDCRLTDSLQEALWKKLIWNIPFNGLTIAAGGVTTDQILSSKPLSEVGLELMYEIQLAAAAYGFAIDDKFIERQYPFTKPMGAYSPSSLTDFKASRPVEVEAIFGEPLRRGQAAGVQMPHLHTLYANLHRLST